MNTITIIVFIIFFLIIIGVYLFRGGFGIGTLTRNFVLNFCNNIKGNLFAIEIPNGNIKGLQNILIKTSTDFLKENTKKMPQTINYNEDIITIIENNIKAEDIEDYLIATITYTLMIFFTIKKGLSYDEEILQDLSSSRIQNIIKREVQSSFTKYSPGMAKLKILNNSL